MKLKELNRKQILTLLAIPLMIAALFIIPIYADRLFGVSPVYAAFGMIIIYFLIDQWMKRS